MTMTWTASKAFDIVTEALERAGCRTTQDGRQRSYTCPGHEDHRPSLSVTDATGRVLIKCHAGCDVDDLLVKLGLNRSDLFDQQPERNHHERRRVVAEYPYVSEAGELLFVKLRYVPKDFRVKRPDGHGGWEWEIGAGTPSVLYRLPRIIAAGPDDLIWLAEGEKDVHALEARGQIATTNYEGASDSAEHPKWRADPHEGPGTAAKYATLMSLPQSAGVVVPATGFRPSARWSTVSSADHRDVRRCRGDRPATAAPAPPARTWSTR